MGAKVHGHCSSTIRKSWPEPQKSKLLTRSAASPFSSGVIPAVVGEVFHLAPAQQFQGTRGLGMCAGNQNRPYQTQRSDIGTTKRGAGNRRDTAVIANARNGSGLAVGDAKRWHPEFLGSKRSFHRVPQALAEADRDQQILPGQGSDSSLDISGAADWCLSGKSESHQAVSQVPAQSRRQVDPHNQDPASALHLLG